jgi:hypothetical protein
VDAGPHDRNHVPVRVPLILPNAFGGASAAVVVHEDTGRSLPAQLTRPSLLAQPPRPLRSTEVWLELHFLLPGLKAGASTVLKASLSGAGLPAGEGFSWHDTPGDHTDLRFGQRPVLRYMYKALDDSSREQREQTYKVFHHLFDPAGERLVTKGPGGLYTHHRGLFFGFNRVTYGNGKKADIWHCPGDTHQSHERFLVQEAGPVLGRHRVEIAWHGPGKEVFAREERELTAYHVPGGQLVEFASRVRSTTGPVKLDGDPQHAGFHFRAADEVASTTKNQTYFVRPDGPGKPGETRNWDPKTRKGPVNLPWDAMSFVLGGARYTAAYLDRPANPKEARFSERDYGRFGSYFEYEVTEKNPLEVSYRVWLQEGEMTVPQVNALSTGFIEPVVATVR